MDFADRGVRGTAQAWSATMGNCDIRMTSADVRASHKSRCLQPPVNLIEEETQWLRRPDQIMTTAAEPKVVATRWRAFEDRTREVSAETPADCSVVGMALRCQNARLSVSGRTIHDGTAIAGTLFMTAPAIRAHGVFRGPFDEIHLHVPNTLVAEYGRDMLGRSETALCSGAVLTRDPIVDRLVRTLLGAEDLGGSLGRICVDSISTAIIARLLGLAHRSNASERSKMTGLIKWRLKRAIDYIEARLSEPMSLADVASAVGLTRMHFAAQFKAATGLRPHEYVLRRRIERAQEMIAANEMPLVQVGLSVGFQTQSHFTAVFKRFVGEPPRAWNQARRELAQ
jgi:AraC family transcriptional regulator